MQVAIPGGLETVYVIMNLKEDTQYEVKARMYSNTGKGPFSDSKIVKTDIGEYCERGSQRSVGTQLLCNSIRTEMADEEKWMIVLARYIDGN